MADNKGSVQIHVEYVALRVALGALNLLPARLAYALADGAGDLLFRFDRRHREVATHNLAAVFGGSPDDERHRGTARQVFRNFVRVGVEFARLSNLIERRGLDAVVDVRHPEYVTEALAKGTGVVVFSAHFGNWELIAAAGEPLGMRLHSVGRALDNPLIDRHLTRMRERFSRSVIPKRGGLPRIVRALKNGDCVAMLLDQHAGRQGLWLDFLGRPASTFRAAAELAVRYNLPMLGGYGIRVDASPRFRLEFEPPLWPDPAADREREVVRLTQAVNDSIARRVREHPAQWNWLHRRWRHRKRRGKDRVRRESERVA